MVGYMTWISLALSASGPDLKQHAGSLQTPTHVSPGSAYQLTQADCATQPSHDAV